MRKRLFEIIEAAHEGDKASNLYDAVMMAVIVISIVPLAFKSTNVYFTVIDQVAAYIFIVDYEYDYQGGIRGANFRIGSYGITYDIAGQTRWSS